jgi:hypothetical protein
MKTAKEMTDQELFEELRFLVIMHGERWDVEVLHEFRERFNERHRQGAAGGPDR